MLIKSLLLTVLLLVSACGKSTIEPPPDDPLVGKVTVSPKSVALRVGDTLNVSVAVTDMNGAPIEHNISWAVRSPRVAAHPGQDRFVAADTGATYIVGTQGGKADSVLFVVTGQPPFDTFLSVTPASATLSVGDTLKLTASGGARGGSFVWSVTDSAIISVSQTGIVKSKKAGSATVKVFASPDPTNVATAVIQVK